MQRLRGETYLADGAIDRADLDDEGRYRMPGDDRSWHLLIRGENGGINGCVRSLPYRGRIDFADLAVKRSALATDGRWGAPLRRAVEAEIRRAKQLGVDFFEIGGWAVTKELRGTRAALYTALGAYAIGQILGGGVGIATATKRNRSADILRRIGGRPLVSSNGELPSYYDPNYRCEMQLLSFDTFRINRLFANQLDALRNHVRSVRVVCPDRAPATMPMYANVEHMVRRPQLALA